MTDQERNSLNRSVRELATLLLNEDHGIGYDAYQVLYELMYDYDCADIVKRVHATDGRFYLPQE